jgi:LPXTG-motif cell wall-anchored protein
MSCCSGNLHADGDGQNQLDYGKIATYAGIAVVLSAAIYLVFKKKRK